MALSGQPERMETGKPSRGRGAQPMRGEREG
jgi:hypothetical protein